MRNEYSKNEKSYSRGRQDHKPHRKNNKENDRTFRHKRNDKTDEQKKKRMPFDIFFDSYWTHDMDWVESKGAFGISARNGSNRS